MSQKEPMVQTETKISVQISDAKNLADKHEKLSAYYSYDKQLSRMHKQLALVHSQIYLTLKKLEKKV